jgi:hypothetical protein
MFGLPLSLSSRGLRLNPLVPTMQAAEGILIVNTLKLRTQSLTLRMSEHIQIGLVIPKYEVLTFDRTDCVPISISNERDLLRRHPGHSCSSVSLISFKISPPLALVA